MGVVQFLHSSHSVSPLPTDTVADKGCCCCWLESLAFLVHSVGHWPLLGFPGGGGGVEGEE